MRKLYRIVLFFLVIMFFILSLNLFFYKKSSAFSLGFGGPIILVTVCIDGIMLTVGPPVPGNYLLTVGSTLYAFYSLHPGAWTLGTYFPGGACACPDGCCLCPPIPAGIIEGTGTSQ